MISPEYLCVLTGCDGQITPPVQQQPCWRPERVASTVNSERWQSLVECSRLKSCSRCSQHRPWVQILLAPPFSGQSADSRNGIDMKACSGARVKAKGSKRTQPEERVLCAMPVAMINHTLGLELEPGRVVLTRGAQVHAKRQHPADYEACLPHLEAVIADPLYVGDDHRNPGIELISRVPVADLFILVAINLERDAHGRYVIASFYPVSKLKIENRKQRGFLYVGRKPIP